MKEICGIIAICCCLLALFFVNNKETPKEEPPNDNTLYLDIGSTGDIESYTVTITIDNETVRKWAWNRSKP
jgi:hypothetical protein